MEINVRDENNVEEIVEKIRNKYFNGSNIDTPEDEQRLVDVNNLEFLSEDTLTSIPSTFRCIPIVHSSIPTTK